MKRKMRNLLINTLVYSVIVVPLAIPLLGMAWLVAQSFSEKVIVGLLPSGFTLEHFSFLWRQIKFGTKVYPNIWPVVRNSLFLCLIMVPTEVLISSSAAYALSRMKAPGRGAIMNFIVFLHAFPGVLMLIALLYLLVQMGLYGKGVLTLIGVALVKVALNVPMSAWILKGFFDGIPWELEWAALVDGCTKFQVWKKVLLPIIKPGISAIAIFSFMSGWGEWLIAYTYLRDPEYYTFPVLLSSLVYEFRFVDWGLLAAMSLFYIIPTLVMYALTQKTLLKIQLVGAVKG